MLLPTSPSRSIRSASPRARVAASPLAILCSLLTLASCSGSDDGPTGFRFISPPTGTVQTEAGAAYTLQIDVAGEDMTPTYELLQSPAGMNIDAAGALTWTPAIGDLGTALIEVRVNDANQSITNQWSVRVHRGVLMGTAYSPPGFESSVETSSAVAYLSDRTAGRVIGYHTNWRTNGDTNGEVPGFLQTAIAARSQFGVEPTLVIGWSNGSAVADLTSDAQPFNNTWSNTETRQEFKDMCVAFAQANQPKHMALANEFNIWWASHQAQFMDWQTIYIETYDAIKAVSPETLVYVTFQLEFLKDDATNTGWAGGVTWAAFDQMNATGRLDVAAFTSYPYFEYATPAAIAADHYSEITSHWQAGPVYFTEIGWLAAPSGPYPGSEADQAAFVERFFELNEGLDLRLAQWLFAHDVDSQAMFPPFVGIGLRNNDASVIRDVDAAWRSAVTLREER